MYIPATGNPSYQQMINNFNPRKIYESEMAQMENRILLGNSYNFADEMARELGVGNNVDIRI